MTAVFPESESTTDVDVDEIVEIVEVDEIVEVVEIVEVTEPAGLAEAELIDVLVNRNR